LAIILGDGAFRIWIGKDKKTNRFNNIGIRIQEKKFPAGVELETTIEHLTSGIEALIYKYCPWCK